MGGASKKPPGSTLIPNIDVGTVFYQGCDLPRSVSQIGDPENDCIRVGVASKPTERETNSHQKKPDTTPPGNGQRHPSGLSASILLSHAQQKNLAFAPRHPPAGQTWPDPRRTNRQIGLLLPHLQDLQVRRLLDGHGGHGVRAPEHLDDWATGRLALRRGVAKRGQYKKLLRRGRKKPSRSWSDPKVGGGELGNFTGRF